MKLNIIGQIFMHISLVIILKQDPRMYIIYFMQMLISSYFKSCYYLHWIQERSVYSCQYYFTTN